MLKATLYFVTKSTLPSEISENSEADQGSMPHLGCNSCACGNNQQVKTVNYCRFSYLGNWELVKLIVGTKFTRSHVYILKWEIDCDNQFIIFSQFWYIFKITMKWLCSSSLCYDNFCIKTGTSDKVKYCRRPKNTET